MAALIGVSIKPKSGGGYTAKIPLDLLAQDGVPPETGDTISCSIEATVQSVDAEDATVKITSVNGQPVDESPAEETAEDSGAGGAGAGPSTADMGAALRKGAKGQPMPF
jgi:hypothetical protein